MVLVTGYFTLLDIPPFYAFVDLDGKFTKILPFGFGMTYVVIPALLTNRVMLMYWMEDPTQISVFVSTYSTV